ncbi:MAG: NAD-glutamate dehydrogenase [marine bacterium B5-7]|nr:MAG: NAD-glutamate dehydrogenase [marine bacterium B5-7]
MPIHTTPFVKELIPNLMQEAQKRLPASEAKLIEPFLEQYYHQVVLDEFENTPLSDLYGAAMSHWQHGRTREPRKPIILVYNPDYEKHGWQSTHTIIEVVTDNMPFLVDTISMVLNRDSLTIHHTLHPVIRNERDNKGKLTGTLHLENGKETGITESYMQFHVDRQTDKATLEKTRVDIASALEDVSLAFDGWPDMLAAVGKLAQSIDKDKSEDKSERTETADMLRWIANDHFTLLGYCEFNIKSDDTLEIDKDSILGILNKDGLSINDIEAMVLPCSAERFLAQANHLTINKTNQRSTVHRPAYMDLIAIRQTGATPGSGRVSCIVGLFTSAAYNRNTSEIPYLRSKVDRIMAASKLPKHGHLEKALQNVIETYPRDSLFQVPDNELEPILLGILHLQERQHIRLFVAAEPFGRFHSCLVFVPRDQFHSDLRIRIQELLLKAFDGVNIEFNVLFSESVLARIHFLVHVRPDSEVEPDLALLGRQIEEASLSWYDRLKTTLVEQFGEESGIRDYNRFYNAFPGSYQDDFSPRRAAYDIQRIQEIISTGKLGIYFYQPVDVMDSSVRLRLYSLGEEVALSDVIPMIENMGLKVLGENPYMIHPNDETDIWIHEFTLTDQKSRKIDVEKHREHFEEALAHIWAGEIENDGFNRLVLSAGLHWRECVVLRAYAKYLKQIRVRYGQDYIMETLNGNPQMCAKLAEYFHQRFDTKITDDRTTHLESIRSELNEGLEQIVNLDEDRIISSYINLIESTIRTNFYQPGETDAHKSYVSFKLDPGKIQRMPEPRPMFEIFVYSSRVEAVHLRGGPVARGGLRWSDRPEDFRTEVLGLVKAQMVKNAVIVPVGSKGGFVVKKMPQGDRETQMAEVIDCYKTFIRGMLDITDNIVDDAIVHPDDVVRHDSDDPYLVVAADKGTATFSDIANGVARDYGFWLDDAFASGGSAGYDHKKMGITARGAWESVKRHFRELGVDTQSQPFSVIGIGDMGGDVFGNGMLLSEHIRLVGAFNHMHIFLDPDPDEAASFKERKRLFNMPRSSWEDYNSKLISKGGGIYKRSEKSITLNDEVRAALGVNSSKLTPTELINVMLKAPVDLIWNGGIGTYVKSTSETDEQVRDRANDTLRVNGSDLRCKVFGEGGNLGMTQLGRIEFNSKGGLCYTDSIDNSAGVDTSDHEVNIKILLDRSVRAGDLTEKQRNKLLESMTDEVAALVLRDNYNQTQAISLAAANAPELMRQQMRFIRALEREGVLNRSLEYLPDEETTAERIQNRQGLHRAEISVLLAYSKLRLNDELIISDVPEDPFLSSRLSEYFPSILGEKFPKVMVEHRLRREIIITYIANEMVNRAGPTFAFRLKELTGGSYPHIARAYTVATEVFNHKTIVHAIEGLDNVVNDSVQKSMISDVVGLIERATSWLVQHRPESMNISDAVEYFKGGVDDLLASYPRSMAASNRLQQKKRAQKLIQAGVPKDLAQTVSSVVALSSALDIIEVARESRQDVAHVAGVYYGIGDRLEIHWLREKISELQIRNHWQAMASYSLRNDLHEQQKALARLIVESAPGALGRKAMQNWVKANQVSCDRFIQLINDFKASREIDFAMLSVAISQVKSMQTASASTAS